MSDDARISALRATAHPLRLRILSLLTGSAMSASEVARELGTTPANASYHLRQLLDAGELEEAGEEKIRGGVAKRYRYPHERRGTPRSSPGTERPSIEDQQHYAQALASELQRRLVDREPRPPGDDAERGLSTDLDGWVDPEAWARAAALLREASALLHDANRPPRTPGTVHVSFTGWAFRMKDDER
jgi:DNA-binding transcriptional ArsR family regulator